MASCHTHAAIVTSIGGYGILPYPRCHYSHPQEGMASCHTHAAIVTFIGGYGILPYPRHHYSHP
ncbi:hypothetical protein [Leyella stercorea]|uniref:hypothetical protein n=1 Tax=Leyella stercorea TaxID=363265 RepID=UPI002430F1FC|nr:hypothetical protein [Leyella stercorea]